MQDFFTRHNSSPLTSPTAPQVNKLEAALTDYVYLQTPTAMIATLFGIAIVVGGFYLTHGATPSLYMWAAICIGATLYRITLAFIYFHYKKPPLSSRQIVFWQSLYLTGVIAGGLSWSLPGFILFPTATPMQNSLVFLIVAGVSAGGVPLLAGLPVIAGIFLALTLLPYALTIEWYASKYYPLFDGAISLYFIYLLYLATQTYQTIKETIQLRFENDVLLNNLTMAKKKLEESNKRLERLATHDPLTDIANRNLFEMSVNTAIKHAEMKKRKLAILFLDIDQFKQINDRYGHYAGDQVLVEIVKRLREYFDPNKNMARLGGDELAIIIEDIHEPEEVDVMANLVCEKIANPIIVDQATIYATSSIGISIYPDDTTSKEELLQIADRNMYYIKNKGGNNFYRNRETLKIT